MKAPASPAAIEFHLLGPVEAVRNGETLPLGGSRQRALLALLLLEPERLVAAERLCEELWLGRPPHGARKTLHSYVSRLRSVLGGDVAIKGGGAGYVLDVPAESVDAHRFERLLEEGQQALARGAARRAAERLAAALELWRGRRHDGLGRLCPRSPTTRRYTRRVLSTTAILVPAAALPVASASVRRPRRRSTSRLTPCAQARASARP